MELSERARLLPRVSRLAELPSSFCSDEDDDGDLPCRDMAQQDPWPWCPPRPSPFSRCVRCLAFLWNLLFLLLGLLLLALGVWGLLAKAAQHLGAPLGSDPMLLFLLGGLGASAVSLAGCLGALRASPCLLRFVLGALLTLGGLQVLGGLLLVLARRRLRDLLRDLLLLCLLRYRDDPDLQFLMDEVQRSLQCCGLDSYRDWESNPYFNCSSPGVQACGVPGSCCQDSPQSGSVPNAQCGFGALALGPAAAGAVVHVGGCEAALGAWLRSQAGAIAVGATALVLVEAVGAFMALRVLRDAVAFRAWG
ncbi:tetraspanin-10 [Pithys albifrons albifrons]|uniref:tetraspanin-10 n=1 Tax=Pithys albifrons albifrons TaxID=3385563 RepID=UPI003A5D0CD7